MNIVSMALAVALLASLIVNFALAGQLQKTNKKMEKWKHERYW